MGYGYIPDFPQRNQMFVPNMQMMQAQQMPQQIPQQIMQDDKIYVASKAAAEAYYVVPNGFVRLWDSNKNTFYEKRTDANGRVLPLQEYDYFLKKEETQQQITQQNTNYVTHDEFDDLMQKYMDLSDRFSSISIQQKSNKNNQQKGNMNDDAK